MKRRHPGHPALLLLLLASARCDGAMSEAVAQAKRITPRTAIRIGVLIDDGSPARENFTAAAELARAQINEGLARARSDFRLELIVGRYGGTTGETQATRTIALVNTDGVQGVVSDVSGVPAGVTGTAAVNRLNYETPARIDHPIPVTCYQCSSAFFNDPAQPDPGFADPDGWLWRTFFNATFESAVQVQLVLNRPAQGDLDGNGTTKIVVYYDAAHLSAATTLPGIMDRLHPGAHAVELIQKVLPSSASSRAAELARVFDAHNETTGADDGPPDSVYLAFLPQNVAESLADYTSHPVAQRPPATANNGARRDFLLPTLLASGGEGLEGNSVRVAAQSRSGKAFLSSFEAERGEKPELTASFLYDAVAVHVLAALIAAESGGQDPENLRDALGFISVPGGRKVPATAQGFRRAARWIEAGRTIDYDGAASSVDLTAPAGEMFPELVHWRIQGGQFVELESYRCDPQAPLCQLQP